MAQRASASSGALGVSSHRGAANNKRLAPRHLIAARYLLKATAGGQAGSPSL